MGAVHGHGHGHGHGHHVQEGTKIEKQRSEEIEKSLEVQHSAPKNIQVLMLGLENSGKKNSNETNPNSLWNWSGYRGNQNLCSHYSKKCGYKHATYAK